MSRRGTPEYKQWKTLLYRWGLWDNRNNLFGYPDGINKVLLAKWTKRERPSQMPTHYEFFGLAMFLLGNGIQPSDVWHIFTFHPIWGGRKANRKINRILRDFREGRLAGASYWDRTTQHSEVIERPLDQMDANLFINHYLNNR